VLCCVVLCCVVLCCVFVCSVCALFFLTSFMSEFVQQNLWTYETIRYVCLYICINKHKIQISSPLLFVIFIIYNVLLQIYMCTATTSS
jgi:hypothetical protein